MAHLVRTRAKIGEAATDFGKLAAQLRIERDKGALNTVFQLLNCFEGLKRMAPVGIYRRLPIKVPRLQPVYPHRLAMLIEKRRSERTNPGFDTVVKLVAILGRIVVPVVLEPDQLPVTPHSRVFCHLPSRAQELEKKGHRARARVEDDSVARLARPFPGHSCPVPEAVAGSQGLLGAAPRTRRPDFPSFGCTRP